MTTDVRPAAASSRPRPPILGRIASWSFLHRGRAIAAWLLLLIAVTGIGRVAGSAFRDDFSGGNPLPSTPSQAHFLNHTEPLARLQGRPISHRAWGRYVPPGEYPAFRR